MDTRLQHRLYLVAKRVYLFQLGWSLAVVWLVAALTGWGLLKGAEQIALPKSSVWIWLGVTAAATIVTMIMLRFAVPRFRCDCCESRTRVSGAESAIDNCSELATKCGERKVWLLATVGDIRSDPA